MNTLKLDLSKFKPHDDVEMRAALAANWTRSDLIWERYQEEGCENFATGDFAQAAHSWRQAYLIARFKFADNDLRQATTLVNCALIARQNNNEAKAQKLLSEAQKIWRQSDEFLVNMKIIRRARSSAFHLRMEARHWDTYVSNTHMKYQQLAREVAVAIEALFKKETMECRLFSRWRGEKPRVFDDTRKFLSAAFLMGGRTPELVTV